MSRPGRSSGDVGRMRGSPGRIRGAGRVPVDPSAVGRSILRAEAGRSLSVLLASAVGRSILRAEAGRSLSVLLASALRASAD